MVLALDNILQLFSEHSRKIAAAISIVLIILMSLTVAKSVLVVLEAGSPPVATPKAKNSSQSRDNKVYKVSDLELFGKAAANKPVQQVIDAPTTKLNLELQGVFIAEDEKRSTAIVGERNKTGELFEIGDRLPGNATLEAVFVDHVLLRRGSRLEKLMFADTKYRIEKTKQTPSVAANQPTGMNPQTRSNLEQIRNRIRNRPDPALQQSAGETGSTSGLSEYRQKLKDNPAAVLGEAGITAVSDGESKGYRIGEDAQSTIRQAGLQPGDVIVSVNGRPVGVAANDTALIDQVMSSSRVRVEVKRGERRFFLTVPVPK